MALNIQTNSYSALSALARPYKRTDSRALQKFVITRTPECSASAAGPGGLVTSDVKPGPGRCREAPLSLVCFASRLGADHTMKPQLPPPLPWR